MEYNRFSLSFPEPLEGKFREYYFKTSISAIRSSLLIAILLYASVGMLDSFLFPEFKSLFIFIRLGVVSPLAVIVLFLSYSKKFFNYWQFVISSVVIIGGAAIVLMIVMAPNPGNTSYYAGLILVLIYNYTISKLRFIAASITGWIIVLVYTVNSNFFIEIDYAVALANNLFLIGANLFGMFSGYLIEYFSRKEFYTNQLLIEEKENVKNINHDLEKSIAERTGELVTANQKLSVNKERYKRALEIGKMGNWEYDIQTGLFWVSNQTKKILGIDPALEFITEDEVGINIIEKDKLKNSLTNLINEKSNYHHEFTITGNNSDQTKIILSIAELITGDNNKPVKVVGFIQDITERKQAENRQTLIVRILSILNRRNEWQKLLHDILIEIKHFTKLDAVAIRLKKGTGYPFFASYGFSERFLSAEKESCWQNVNGEATCKSTGQLSSNCMCSFVLSGNGSSTHPFFTELGSFWTNKNSEFGHVSTGSGLFAESKRLCLVEGFESLALIPLYSGGEIFGLLHLSSKKDDQFSLDMIHFFEELGSAIGIANKRMFSEKRIRENEARFRNLFENSPVAIWEKDYSEVKKYLKSVLEGKAPGIKEYLQENPDVVTKCLNLVIAKDINQATVKMFNAANKNEFISKAENTYTDDYRKAFIEGIAGIMNGESHINSETAFKTIDGEIKYVLIDWQVSPGYEESLASVLVTIIDITKRKIAEKELAESESRIRGLYENATIGLYRTTPEGEILLANPTIIKMLGYESFDELVRSGDVNTKYINLKLRERFKKIIEEKDLIHDFENIWKKKDGTEICVRESAKAMRDKEGKTLYYEGVVEDITSRKQAEEKIKMLAHAVEGVSECVSITDKDNNILFVNDAFQKTYGYSSDELIGENINIVRPESVSDEKRGIIKSETFSGGWRGEIINKRKDGSEFPVLISTSIIRDEMDEIMALVGVAIDITEMKRTGEELIKAKESAEKSEKLKTQFLAQMSHEIRTPINAILNFSSLIKSEVEEIIDPELLDGFSSIDSASKRVIRTIDMLLNMSEIQTGTYEYLPKEFDLREVIEGIKLEFADLAGSKGLDLGLKVLTKETVLYADEYSAGQIFINLIDNAIKYTVKGKIEVAITRDDDNNLGVDVQDTGIGISEEYLPNLFDAFTQEEQGYSRRYEGNGLGLALVKKYCEINNAWVTVESQKNKGTVFKVKFQA